MVDRRLEGGGGGRSDGLTVTEAGYVPTPTLLPRVYMDLSNFESSFRAESLFVPVWF